jgi:hypothetical protein
MKITIEYSDKIEEVSSVAQGIIDNAIKSVRSMGSTPGDVLAEVQLERDNYHKDVINAWEDSDRLRRLLREAEVQYKIEREAGENLRKELDRLQKLCKQYHVPYES